MVKHSLMLGCLVNELYGKSALAFEEGVFKMPVCCSTSTLILAYKSQQVNQRFPNVST